MRDYGISLIRAGVWVLETETLPPASTARSRPMPLAMHNSGTPDGSHVICT